MKKINPALLTLIIIGALFLIWLTIKPHTSQNKPTGKKLKILCVKNGKEYYETITPDDYLDNNKKIRTTFIDSVKFSVLDSVAFVKNRNIEDFTDYSRPVKLDFDKGIEPFSPEYYSLAVAHFITKSINYYDSLFNHKINFNKQKDYSTITIQFGDMEILTTPKRFIIKKGAVLSPSVFYHEIGHRAFWLLESDLGIKFHGLTYVHMGLLEYFTVSLNNSPLVGEKILPESLVRDVSVIHKYPFTDSLKTSYTFKLLKEAYRDQLRDTTSNISKYIRFVENNYGNMLKKTYDNHRSALVITSTLWRIRNKMGKKNTDRLVSETIPGLNKYLDMRPDFYINDKDETIPEYIQWYDLYVGLLQKDMELFNGTYNELIKNEFKKTGFPVWKIKPLQTKTS
ncbi:MAG: hypothetical protein GXO47_10910 [Chlorobi bacterium]|nr:hypothetical protein [Chlorobiota bacterium]